MRLGVDNKNKIKSKSKSKNLSYEQACEDVWNNRMNPF